MNKAKLSSNFYNNFDQFLSEIKDPFEELALSGLFSRDSVALDISKDFNSPNRDSNINITKEEALKKLAEKRN